LIQQRWRCWWNPWGFFINMDGFAEFLSWRVFTERDLGAVQLNFFLKGFHTHTHTQRWVLLNFLLSVFREMRDGCCWVSCLRGFHTERDERWVLLNFFLEGFSHRERDKR
jgi:hypothetical protein